MGCVVVGDTFAGQGSAVSPSCVLLCGQDE